MNRTRFTDSLADKMIRILICNWDNDPFVRSSD